jgi:hypothetical protein
MTPAAMMKMQTNCSAGVVSFHQVGQYAGISVRCTRLLKPRKRAWGEKKETSE